MIRKGAPGAWRHFLDDAERAVVLELWDAGIEATIIAEKLGCSQALISRIAHGAGRSRRRPPTPRHSRDKRRRPAETRHQSIRAAAARHHLGG